MIFVADKSVDKPIVDYLRKERYEIVSIAQKRNLGFLTIMY